MSGRIRSSYEVTTGAPDDSSPSAFRSAGLIALIVLASLCALLGAIYAYIYNRLCHIMVENEDALHQVFLQNLCHCSSETNARITP